MTKRRIFLKQATVLSFLSMPFGLNSNGNQKTTFQTDQRSALKEAGPMIPPVPAILLTVNGKEDKMDEISVVWAFVVNGKPPQIGISVEDVHVALDLIKQHKEFVLNIPTSDMIVPFDMVDMNSTKVMDKFELSGLTRGKAQSINAPVIVESPIHVECRVIHEMRVPPIRTIFVAEVIETTVLPGVCDKDGRLIVENVDFFGMTAGSGEFYTMREPIGHIGKSVGRSDIKY